MGDRGNIVVRDSDGKDVVFYSHWGGHGLAAVVRRAIGKRWRWDDDSYLARIIFCELVSGSEDAETGFGISRFLAGDRGHPVVFVNIKEQTVSFIDEFEVDESASCDKRFTRAFEDFAKMTDAEATELFEASASGGDEDDEDEDEDEEGEDEDDVEKLKAENAALKAENEALKKGGGSKGRGKGR